MICQYLLAWLSMMGKFGEQLSKKVKRYAKYQLCDHEMFMI